MPTIKVDAVEKTVDRGKAQATRALAVVERRKKIVGNLSKNAKGLLLVST
jgi:hypothetical protein